MDLGISEQQELLLYKACEEYNGRLKIGLARNMYSSKNSAHSAIDKLELAGYIERVTPGVWKVIKVTDDIKQELKQRGSESESSKSEVIDDSGNPVDQEAGGGSGYEIQQVN